MDHRISAIADKWTYFFMRSFDDTRVDIGPSVARVWKICVPTGLCELLWKVVFHALPIGDKRSSSKGCGLDYCPCGHQEPIDLFHILSGCQYFPIYDLYRTSLDPAFAKAHSGPGGSHASIDTDRWFCRWWFPAIICPILSPYDDHPRHVPRPPDLSTRWSQLPTTIRTRTTAAPNVRARARILSGSRRVAHTRTTKTRGHSPYARHVCIT